MEFTVRPVAAADRDEWIAMRAALWPDADGSELAAEADAYLRGAGFMLEGVLLVLDATGRTIGFAEISLRPYAEGCATSPVAYLEGWYVRADARRHGAGGALVSAVEAWGRARGCSELASDTELDNAPAAAAHAALGFDEVERIRCFRKSLR